MNSNEINKTLFTIGEVADKLGIAPSVIRYWEKEFSQLSPQKSKNGTRKFTEKDIRLLRLIHHLLKEKGMTIEGVRNGLKDENSTHKQAEVIEKLYHFRSFLIELKNVISSKNK